MKAIKVEAKREIDDGDVQSKKDEEAGLLQLRTDPVPVKAEEQEQDGLNGFLFRMFYVFPKCVFVDSIAKYHC